MIDEANEIAKQLSQNVAFSFGLITVNSSDKGLNLAASNIDMDEKKYDLEVKVNNL